MNIGIVGSGAVGVTLAKGLNELGHKIKLGTNSPDKKPELEKQVSGTPVSNFEEAAMHGDVVILCVKGTAAEEVALSLKSYLAGKTVIDTTNPISDTAPQDGVLGFFTDYSQSLMEVLQEAAPEAHFVKCFNSVGAAVMVKPKFKVQPTMFICGDNPDAKTTTIGLLKELGWEAADMGSAAAARAIEPLCILWCIPGLLNNQWHQAFKFVTE